MGDQHKEAFALMLYRGEKPGRVETMWNTRDGVTPFIISSADRARRAGWRRVPCRVLCLAGR
jgi:hypothetical protein